MTGTPLQQAVQVAYGLTLRVLRGGLQEHGPGHRRPGVPLPCRGRQQQLSEESTAVEWLTPDEATSRTGKVYAVRVTDALLDDDPHVRSHDGRKVIASA